MPTPTPDLMTWVLEAKEHWPKEVKLTQQVNFPVLVNGKAVGNVQAPVGALAKVTNLQAGQITVTWMNQAKILPVDATDLIQRVPAEMKRVETAKAAPQSTASLQPVTPAATPSSTPQITPAPGSGVVVTTLAGSAGNSGYSDGKGSAALFNFSEAWNFGNVAVDGKGNVYVTDYGNNAIRKITPDGVVTSFLTRGNGHPFGVAVDKSGKIFVTTGCSIQKMFPKGMITTLAGNAGNPGFSDGPGSAARFNKTMGLAVDGTGNIYVADSGNYTIRKITPGGKVTTLAGSAGNPGTNDGTGSSARFIHPQAVAVDSSGNVYVTDFVSKDNPMSHIVRKITPDGTVTPFASSYSMHIDSDRGNTARDGPYGGVAVDRSGNVYVTVEGGGRAIWKITPDGVVTILAGNDVEIGSSDGTGSAARFSRPLGVAVDDSGNIYVADARIQTVSKIMPGGESGHKPQK